MHDDHENTDNTPQNGSEDKNSITRRDVVKKAWVAPVIIAVNLPNGVFAQSAISPVATPSAPIAPAPSAPIASTPAGP